MNWTHEKRRTAELYRRGLIDRALAVVLWEYESREQEKAKERRTKTT